MNDAGPALLLVEDDEPARRLLRSYLLRLGYRVDEAGDARGALELWDAHRADLILLDLGLPDRDGIDVIRRVRSETTTPIIILSARGEEGDKIAGLEAGADDYLAKPFSPGELHARIQAVLRRSAGPQADKDGRLRLGAIELDVIRREVFVSGRPVSLTPREYELLKVFLANTGRVVTKGRLLRAVWGVAYVEESHYVYVYVNRLRRKLSAADPAAGADDLITTEPGVGYRVASVQPAPSAKPGRAPGR
jgi:two-component system KDP operon response regulator KdpE